MDFLSKSYAQLAELFRSMTPAARITSALLLVVIVVSFGYLFNSHLSGPDVYLLQGFAFPQADMPRIQEAFAAKGLSDYEVIGTQIKVPRGQHVAYVAALGEADALPEDFSQEMLETMNRDGVFASNAQREATLKVAMEHRLSQIISEMSFVEKAHVLFDVQQKKGGPTRQMLSSATVTVFPAGSRPLTGDQVRTIRATVAGANAHITAQEVAVVDAKNGITVSGSDGTGVGSAVDDPVLSRKREYERDYRDKILTRLNYIDGVTVEVNAELNNEVNHIKDTTEYPGQQGKTVRSTTTTVKDISENNGPAGRPGFESNRPNANQGARVATTTKLNSQQKTEQKEDAETIFPTTRDRTEFQGLTLKQLSATVGIPIIYFEQIWHKENPTPDGQEPKTPGPTEVEQIVAREIPNIRTLLLPIIKAPEGTAAEDLIHVAAFIPMPSHEMPEEGVSERAFSWLGQYWSTLGMLFLGLVSMLMLRSMIRAVPPEPQSHSGPMILPFSGADDARGDGQDVTPSGPVLKRKSSTGPNLRDELAVLVREDPDSAAAILSNWISNAG